jgi:hypothetical protein
MSVNAGLVLVVVSLALVAAVTLPVDENAIISVAGENREGCETPEAAAVEMFLACSMRSPKLFIQTRLLGVCDGPIATLNKYAECLHTTEYSNGETAFTVYDLPKQMKKETARAVAGQAFDTDDKDVAHLLMFAGISSYYGKQFMCFDVAADNYDGIEYRTRIVVAMLNDRWYAVPRCRSSKAFYEIADAMSLTSSESEDAE